MRTRQEQFGIDAKTRDNVTVTMAIAAQYRVSAQPASQDSLGRGALLHAGQSHGPDAPYLIDAQAPACRSTPSMRCSTRRRHRLGCEPDGIRPHGGFRLRRGEHAHHVHRSARRRGAVHEPHQLRPAREKEAAQSLAEAERIKVVTEARARAEAMEQAGRGIAASAARPSQTASQSRSRSSRAPACRRPRQTSCSSSPSGPT